MPRPPGRPKGHIRRRGSRYWVYVPRGRDPVTDRYRYAYDSADTMEEAERKRDELISRLAAGWRPPPRLTFGVLLDRWLQAAGQEADASAAGQAAIEQMIRQVLGTWKIRDLETRVEILDQLYAHLRRCDKLCGGRPFIEHRGSGGRARIAGPAGADVAGSGPGQTEPGADHDCREAECARHECRPMAASTIRRIHGIISAAYGFAIKQGWADRNPAGHASPPRVPHPTGSGW